MRIVFMGTPEFAVPCLEKLLISHEVIGVITQPDKPKGRGQKVQANPVRQTAEKYKLPVYQPEKLRKDNIFIDNLRKKDIDLMVVVAYGQILPLEVLSIPKYGCINVHASLLPDLRGAAPINWAIIRGYKRTGVTTMLMNEGIDTGDMLMKAEVEIGDEETAEELHDRLMAVGAELLIKTIKGIEEGSIIPEKQDDSKFTYAQMLNKEMGNINWNSDSKSINNLIRGITPWPCAYSFLNGRMIKILKSKIGSTNDGGRPGEILKADRNGIEAACGSGSIIILELQEVGGKRMSVASYINGHNINIGDSFEMGAL